MLCFLEMSPRVILFFGNFFFSVATALSVYVLIPFLSSYMPEAYTGLVIAAGGLVSLSIFFLLPHWEARYGIQRLALVFATTEMFSLLALAVAPGAVSGILFLVMVLALQPCISYGLDLLLEATKDTDDSMGRIRTTFLTAWNTGVLAAPLLLAAILVNSNEYSRVFMVGAAMLIPFIILFIVRTLPTSTPRHPSHMRDTLVCIAHDRDFSAVTVAHFLLYLFYIWAPYYVPMYLHNELGIAWATLGWIFAIMLIPYVLLEYPAGWIADRLFGDKELMFIGFCIAGTALASLSMLTPSSSFTLILLILLASRVGAALIEGMTEGHFFRRVTAQDVNSISFFRSVWPLANIVAPLIASIILLYGNFHVFFLITGGCIALVGMIVTLFIRDFR